MNLVSVRPCFAEDLPNEIELGALDSAGLAALVPAELPIVFVCFAAQPVFGQLAPNSAGFAVPAI